MQKTLNPSLTDEAQGLLKGLMIGLFLLRFE
jgi:hypothetical protein